jgi:hypothetical protein
MPLDTSNDSRPDTDHSRPAPRQQQCDIGPRNIPVVMKDRLGKPIESTVRWFCGDESGVHEPCEYSFWSVLAGPVPLLVFRVADGRTMECELRERARMTPRQIDLLHKFADRVMPATLDEVDLWLQSHPADAPFLLPGAPG